MKHNRFIQYTWELPQNLVGLFVKYTFGTRPAAQYKDAEVRLWNMRGSISLGEHIFVSLSSPDFESDYAKRLVSHEYGHTLQSQKLGWLYLPVIGLPSIIWAGLFGNYCKKNNISYYSFYTEKWADKLGNVIRD